jgi:hypothetical protein
VAVTVLGGSISTGAVASRKMAKENPNDVWSLVRLYMQRNINGELEFNNMARSATKSYITSLCLEKFLDETQVGGCGHGTGTRHQHTLASVPLGLQTTTALPDLT